MPSATASSAPHQKAFRRAAESLIVLKRFENVSATQSPNCCSHGGNGIPEIHKLRLEWHSIRPARCCCSYVSSKFISLFVHVGCDKWPLGAARPPCDVSAWFQMPVLLLLLLTLTIPLLLLLLLLLLMLLTLLMMLTSLPQLLVSSHNETSLDSLLLILLLPSLIQLPPPTPKLSD
jgi:hypothetical protein